MARIPSPRANGTDKLPPGFMQWADWGHRLLTGLVDAAADLVSLDARVTALEDAPPSGVAGSTFFEFSHPGQGGASTTRRMWGMGLPGTAGWNSGYQNYDRRIIPYDGTLKKLVTANPTATSGGSNTITFTVLKSTDGGSTWSSTSLTTSTTASDTTTQTSSVDVSVSAGDKIAVEITFSGAVTQNTSTACMYAGIWYEKS